MNKDQVKGTLEKAKGQVKETTGKVVGNERLEAEGQADQASGAVQKKVGDVKEAAKTLTKAP
jgi:uncharacterized protein YjbJ (UPF0337 family)